MTYDLAMRAMETAEAHARQQVWNVTIVITDQNGSPVIWLAECEKLETLHAFKTKGIAHGFKGGEVLEVGRF